MQLQQCTGMARLYENLNCLLQPKASVNVPVAQLAEETSRLSHRPGAAQDAASRRIRALVPFWFSAHRTNAMSGLEGAGSSFHASSSVLRPRSYEWSELLREKGGSGVGVVSPVKCSGDSNQEHSWTAEEIACM